MIYDVIVCGGGPSGLCASISASRNGAKVLLIESSALLGGTNVLSLVNPLMSFHNQDGQVIKGIGEEIIQRLASEKQALGHIKDPLGFCATVSPVNIEALKSLYFDMVQEANIDCLFHANIIRVEVTGKSITSIVVNTKGDERRYFGKTIIDATGNGDIAYLAGCSYIMGRVSDNLCQPMTMPFIVGNIDFEQVKTAIKANPTNFVVRSDYDYQYVGVSGFFNEVKEAKKNGDFDIERDRVLFFQNANLDEATINMSRVIKKNGCNIEDLSAAEIEGRNQIKEIFKFLKEYIPGFANSYIKQTPYQIGIRETRHINTKYIMTKADIMNNATFASSIAVGAYPMDIHSPNGAKMEFDSDQSIHTYEIPLEVMLVADIDNLIVTGRAIGATHEASASMRVTPVVMALGEAAGVLAAMGKNTSITKVSIVELQKALEKENQIIHN